MTSHGKDVVESPSDVGDSSGHGLGIRHVQVAVMSTASFLAYVSRLNLSVAMVAMTDSRNDTNATNFDVPVVDWNEKVQGYVLSSFFWGYFIAQIPSGLLAEKFGGHRFLCGSNLASSLLSVLFPQCVYMGGWMLASLNRALQGVTQGVIYASIFSLLGVWAHPLERGRFASVSLGASLMGIVVTSPLSGVLCAAYGWPSVFYVLGGISAALTLIMIFLGADSPSKHRMISDAEKNFIQSSLGGAKEKVKVPWRQFSKCVPLYALTFVFVLRQLVFATFQAYTPIFLGTVLMLDIVDNGVISGLPSLVSWLLTFVCSFICDLLIRRRWLRITTSRKLFTSIAYFGSAIFLVLLAHAPSKISAIVFLFLAIGIQSGFYVGVEATFLDLAPNFSGATFSVANFVSVGLCVWGPYVIGLIVYEQGSAAQWRLVFYLFASLLTAGNVVYLMWGTSETQWWNWPDKYKSKQEYEEEKAKLGQHAGC